MHAATAQPVVGSTSCRRSPMLGASNPTVTAPRERRHGSSSTGSPTHLSPLGAIAVPRAPSAQRLHDLCATLDTAQSPADLQQALTAAAREIAGGTIAALLIP